MGAQQSMENQQATTRLKNKIIFSSCFFLTSGRKTINWI